MTSLIDIKEGVTVKIKHLVCGNGIKHRLCSMGLSNGQCIQMIKNDIHGPLVIQVFDSKLAIGRGQASKIDVEIC